MYRNNIPASKALSDDPALQLTTLLFLFLVVIYRRYIAKCRLKSVGFTTSRKINSLVLRI